MSQASAMAGDGYAVKNAKAASSGRAALLLAVFVLLGVALLNALDDREALDATKASAPAAAPTPLAPAPPALPATAPRLPSEVKVLVANGLGVSGAGSRLASRLQPLGYQLLKPGNTTNKETASSVQYIVGYQAEAQQVANSLGLPAMAVQPLATQPPVADMQGAHVVVIVGNELTTPASAGQQGAAGGARTGQVSGGTTGAPLSSGVGTPTPQTAR